MRLAVATTVGEAGGNAFINSVRVLARRACGSTVGASAVSAGCAAGGTSVAGQQPGTTQVDTGVPAAAVVLLAARAAHGRFATGLDREVLAVINTVHNHDIVAGQPVSTAV